MMTCADLEISLCDYVDGTLRGEQKSAVEKHLAGCPACEEFARDCGAAVSFVERVEEVRPPQELMTRIVFETQAIREKEFKKSPLRRWLSKWFAPVLQPRGALHAPGAAAEPSRRRRRACPRTRPPAPTAARAASPALAPGGAAQYGIASIMRKACAIDVSRACTTVPLGPMPVFLKPEKGMSKPYCRPTLSLSLVS